MEHLLPRGQRLASPTNIRRRGRGGGLPAVFTSPTFLLGGFTGMAVYWLVSSLFFFAMGSPKAPSQQSPVDPPSAGGYHAILIPAGGQTEDGPPPHVLARLERAVAIYRMSAEPKPFVITTAWGTPHKPCPQDAAGFERHEAQDNAKYLLDRGVDATRLLEESVSLETVGNAYFARVMHTDVRALRRIVIINNRFHMPRTRAVFGHVFRVPPREGEPDAAYDLEYVEVEDRLPSDVLEARLEKEEKALPKFSKGGPWQSATPTLRDLHDWVHMENSAYASGRLREERQPIDPELLKSY